MKPETILSLFNGISCGRVALERAGIKIGKYYSSEIDKYALQIDRKNYPDNIQLGNVEKWREWDIDWKNIDMVIGGSPCTGFSLAGKGLNFKDPQSKLFLVYNDILKHIQKQNPKVKFLLENVRMLQCWEDIISKYMGVDPIFINSDLVSAQNRVRIYWCNWYVLQPDDKEIYVKDILLPEEKIHKKYYLKAKVEEYAKLNTSDNIRTIKIGYFGSDSQGERVFTPYGKSVTLTTSSFVGFYKINDKQYRKLTPIECERLQTLPDNFTEGVSNTQRYKMLGNGWTVDVIAHIFKCLKDRVEDKQKKLL